MGAAIPFSDSVLPLDRARGLKLELVGQRIFGLFSLARLGLPLPPAWVVPTPVFRGVVAALMSPGHEPSALVHRMDKPRSLEHVARTRERLLTEGMPWARQVLRALPEECTHAKCLAFLTSPSLSDPKVAEEAGLLKTWFYGESGTAAPRVEGLEQALLEAWALACDDLALSTLDRYRIRELEMAVLIVRVDRPLETARFFGRVRVEETLAERSENGDPMYALRGELQPTVSASLCEPTELRSAPLDPIAAELCEWLRPTEGGVDLQVSLSCFGRTPLEGPVVACELRQLSAGSRAAYGPRPTEVWSTLGLGDLRGCLTPLTRSLFSDVDVADLVRAGDVKQWEIPGATSPICWAGGRAFANWRVFERGLGVALSTPTLTRLGLSELADYLVAAPDVSRTTKLAAQAARFQRRLLWIQAELHRLQADAVPYFAAFRELELSILPTDAATTTLHEARHQLLTSWRLWLLAELNVFLGAATFDAWLKAHVPAEIAAAALRAACTPSAEIALARASLDKAQVSTAEWCERWGYLPVQSLELSQPRWDELVGHSAFDVDPPPPSVRGVAMHPAAAAVAGVPGRAEATQAVELTLVERSLSRTNRWLFARSLDSMRQSLALMTTAADALARASWMLRRTVLEVDRRLGRLDARLGKGAAFYCTFAELESAVAHSRTDLSEIVNMRRARLVRDGRESLGGTFAVSQEPQRVPPRSSTNATAFVGNATGRGVVRGPPVIVRREDLDALPPHAIGIVTEFAPWLFLALNQCKGWVVLESHALSPQWVAALQLDRPLVTLPGVTAHTLAAFSELELDSERGRVRGW